MYNASPVDTNSNVVAMMPEVFLKKLLPNNPNSRKPASGSKGISAMYVALGITSPQPSP